mgnify:CR=1 FL=1
MAQPSEFEQMCTNDPSGAQFGKSATEKIAFFGATPVTQPTNSAQTTLATAVTWLTISAGTGFAFNSSDSIISVIAAVKQIQSVLTTLGLWKGS